MIKTGMIGGEASDDYEMWAIVRSPGVLPAGCSWVPELAPSSELFREYREAYHRGKFNRDFFDNVYVPRFLRELSNDKIDLLRSLASISKERNIFLCCFCEDESLCHRSIIAGILLGMGAKIETNWAFRRYFEMYEGFQNRKQLL